LNLIELALAKKIMQEPEQKIKQAVKVFYTLYKFKELNEFEIAEHSNIDLSEVFNALDLLHQRNLITFKKGKYLIPEMLEATHYLTELKETQPIKLFAIT
jgi:transcription initiation factor IIE alpha subunit